MSSRKDEAIMSVRKKRVNLCKGRYCVCLKIGRESVLLSALRVFLAGS